MRMQQRQCKEGLLQIAAKGETIGEQNVRYISRLVRQGQEERIAELTKDVICITAKGKPIKAKTLGQQQYLKAISDHTITIGVGPAGTGKTYLAVAAAVSCISGTAGKPDYSYQTCSGSWGAFGFFAWRYAKQG